MIGLVGYKLGKVSKKELEKLKEESRIAQEEATKHMIERAITEGKNKILEEKIADLEQKRKKRWNDGEIVDAEIIEPKKAPETPEEKLPRQEIPEWAKDTFLTEEAHKNISHQLFTDLSSDTPSQEAKNLQESIANLSNTTGTGYKKA